MKQIMTTISLQEKPKREASELVDALRQYAEPLPAPEQHEAFGQFFDRFSDAQIVLLGEATHGICSFARLVRRDMRNSASGHR